MNSSPSTSANWARLLSGIDRRILYAGLLIFTLAPLVLNLTLPVYVTPPARKFHDTIETLATDKVVYVASNWDAGTYAESEPQTIAMFRQLLRRKLRFVIFAITYPNSPQLAQNAFAEALRLEFPNGVAAGEYPVYGKDYVNCGYKVSSAPWVRSLVQNPTNALKADWKGQPLAEMPIFAGSPKMEDHASLLIDITGSNTTPLWISLVGSQGIKLSLACTAVMAPEQYPYLATDQLMGLLTGMRGAAEYEKLLGTEGRAMRMMGGQSFAHLYLFLLIGLGNVALLRGWTTRRRV
jgi:hypothetical protein